MGGSRSWLLPFVWTLHGWPRSHYRLNKQLDSQVDGVFSGTVAGFWGRVKCIEQAATGDPGRFRLCSRAAVHFRKGKPCSEIFPLWVKSGVPGNSRVKIATGRILLLWGVVGDPSFKEELTQFRW